MDSRWRGFASITRRDATSRLARSAPPSDHVEIAALGSTRVAVIDAPAHLAPDLDFVELESEPTSRGGHLDLLEAERARFHHRARLSGVSLQERYSYTRLWNGLSVHMTAEQIAVLREVEGVKAVFPVHTVDVDDVPNGNVAPDMFTALAMTGADIAQSMLGLTGNKVLVGVIDTGIAMASPHVAGAVALLLEARPGLSATQVRDILQNNAVPEMGTAPNGAVADSVHRHGALRPAQRHCPRGRLGQRHRHHHRRSGPREWQPLRGLSRLHAAGRERRHHPGAVLGLRGRLPGDPDPRPHGAGLPVARP